MFVVLYREQNAGRNHSMNTENRSLEIVDDFKYLVITLTKQNCIKEEIKSILKSGNACCHSVQNRFSSSRLSKNLKTLYNYIFACCFVWV